VGAAGSREGIKGGCGDGCSVGRREGEGEGEGTARAWWGLIVYLSFRFDGSGRWRFKKYVHRRVLCVRVGSCTVCDPGNCSFHHRLLVLHSTKVPGGKKG